MYRAIFDCWGGITCYQSLNYSAFTSCLPSHFAAPYPFHISDIIIRGRLCRVSIASVVDPLNTRFVPNTASEHRAHPHSRRLDLPPSRIPTPSTALPWPLHKVIAMAWITPTMTPSSTLHSLPSSRSPPSQTASGRLGGCKSNLIGRRLWSSRCPARALRTSSPIPFPLSDILSSCRQRSARGW